MMKLVAILRTLLRIKTNGPLTELNMSTERSNTNKELVNSKFPSTTERCLIRNKSSKGTLFLHSQAIRHSGWPVM